MFCSKCGTTKVDGKCPNCDQVISSEQATLEINNLENSSPNVVDAVVNNKITINKKFIIIAGIVLVLVTVIILIFMNKNPARSKVLVEVKESKDLQFKIGDKKYKLGEQLSIYKKDGITYNTEYVKDDAIVYSDSIMTQTFYDNEGKPLFFGAFYCPSGDDCSYDESILIKANFYESSDVVIDDYIEFGMNYDDIVEKYGKEDGTFYQNEELLVWTLGGTGKIGEPYYILYFDNSGWFSTGDLVDIRMGVWWYDGEYEHTVVKEEVSNEK